VAQEFAHGLIPGLLQREQAGTRSRFIALLFRTPI
jgi:hypothetical protein